MINLTQHAASAEQIEAGVTDMVGKDLEYLKAPLTFYLKAAGINPVFAFSKRESVERVVDGKTVKTNVFKHVGFVEV